MIQGMNMNNNNRGMRNVSYLNYSYVCELLNLIFHIILHRTLINLKTWECKIINPMEFIVVIIRTL
jgi:hypothetical protein